mgnify:CR=1 FL=1
MAAIDCGAPLTLPTKAPSNSPSSLPLATLDDGNPKEMATATQPLTTTQAHPPSVAVSGEASTGDAKIGEEMFQAYRTVSQVYAFSAPQPFHAYRPFMW